MCGIIIHNFSKEPEYEKQKTLQKNHKASAGSVSSQDSENDLKKFAEVGKKQD